MFSVNSHLFSRRTEINVRQEGKKKKKKREKEGKKQSTASRLIVNNEKSDLHSRKRLLIFLPMNIRPYPSSWSYILEVELDFVFQSSRFSVNYTRTVNTRQKENSFFFFSSLPFCWTTVEKYFCVCGLRQTWPSPLSFPSWTLTDPQTDLLLDFRSHLPLICDLCFLSSIHFFHISFMLLYVVIYGLTIYNVIWLENYTCICIFGILFYLIFTVTYFICILIIYI